MAQWLRYSHNGSEGFGTLEGGQILVHSGDMFAGAKALEDDLPVEQLS